YLLLLYFLLATSTTDLYTLSLHDALPICFADSSSSANEVMKAVRQIGLRATVYQESFGPDQKLAHENVSRLRDQLGELRALETGDRKSTRLNSSHVKISYAVFCLKKKKKK